MIDVGVKHFPKKEKQDDNSFGERFKTAILNALLSRLIMMNTQIPLITIRASSLDLELLFAIICYCKR